jgi:hypothetical protein
MSYNCHRGDQPHVQSMIWATDSEGLKVIQKEEGIGQCYFDNGAAVAGEIRTTGLLREAGFEVDTFLSVFHSQDKKSKAARLENGMSSVPQDGSISEEEAKARRKAEVEAPGDFWKECKEWDWLLPGGYYGTFVHPYENLFMKSHRGIEDNVLDRLTEWHDGAGWEAYDVCH